MPVLNTNKIKLTGSFSIVLIAIFVWHILSNNQPIDAAITENDTNSASGEMANIANIHTANLSVKNIDTKQPSKNTVVESEDAVSPVVQQFKGTMGNDAANQEDVKNWFGDRGYNIWGAIKEYDSYNEETLKNLADNGDLRALSVLEKLYSSKNTYEGHKMAQAIREKSAIYGSTDALATLGTVKHSEFMSLPATDEGRTPALIEALAFYQAAQLRGDSLSYFTSGNYLINNNGNLLTGDDYQKINTRAQEIYSDLESKRIELGLGKFDNSVPDAVKEFFNKMNPKK